MLRQCDDVAVKRLASEAKGKYVSMAQSQNMCLNARRRRRVGIFIKFCWFQPTLLDTMDKTTLYGHVHGWISEPNGRGTASLLHGCLFTIFICTWTALHMNIPSRKWSISKRFFRKLGYMSMAIIAPEFIFAMAAEGFFTARGHMGRSQDWPENFVEVRYAKLFFLSCNGSILSRR